VEQAEQIMRGQVYPIYNEFVRPILDLIRRIYNPLICWWDAGAWWGYGMIVDVLYPTAKECAQIKPLFVAVYNFLSAVADEIIVWVATGDFMVKDADLTNTTITGIELSRVWVALYMCACTDIGDIVRTLPILNPLIIIGFVIAGPLATLMLILIPFSEEWQDPYTWCAVSGAVNTIGVFFREVFLLASQVLNFLFGLVPPNTPFIRPNLTRIAYYICFTFKCLIRSTENAYQVFWNRYIPFFFDFKNYFAWVDIIVCILVKTVAFLFNTLVNIDQAVLYPQNPYWGLTAKPAVIEILNLYGAPTRFPTVQVPSPPQPLRFNITNYHLDTASQNTPWGTANPMYQQMRLTEAICIVIERTICDPSNNDTACFSEGAANILLGFDFCCITNTLVPVLLDFISGLFEWSLHLSSGPDEFFLFIDSQPFTTLFAADLTILARCLVSVFGLIPVVGTSIRSLFTALARYVLEMLDFLFRVIIGVATLPYFIISMPSIPNFVQKTDVAQNFFVHINEELIAG
jgi:hypothetical protein